MSEIDERFDSQAQAVLSSAREDAKNRGHLQIGPLHLLAAILISDSENIAQIPATEKLNLQSIITETLATLGPQARLASEEPEFKALTREVIKQAFSFAGLRHAQKVSVQDLLLSTLFNHDVAALLGELGVPVLSLQNAARGIVGLVKSSGEIEQPAGDLRAQVNDAIRILSNVSSQLLALEMRGTSR